MSAIDDTVLPPAVGVSGGNLTFQSDGITYQATGLTPNDGGALSLQDVQALVTQATPMAPTYLAQFPWTVPPP